MGSHLSRYTDPDIGEFEGIILGAPLRESLKPAHPAFWGSWLQDAFRKMSLGLVLIYHNIV